MARIDYNETYSYEIYEGNGYDIYVNGAPAPMITQRIPNDKPMDASKSYEENAILQIEELIQQQKQDNESDLDKLRADIDYLALMSDIELPSNIQKEEA